jgi:hypothetical protein
VILISLSSIAQALEANFVEVKLSCEGLKNKPSQRAYNTKFAGIISADGLSFVGHETWKRGGKEFQVKQFRGFMDTKKRTAFIKGEGRSHTNKNGWQLFFKSTDINSFYQALTAGMTGREGTGDWRKPCNLRLIKSVPISNVNLRSKIDALEKSANSSRARYLKSENEARSLQESLGTRLTKIFELKEQLKDKDKNLTAAVSKIDELTDKIKARNLSSNDTKKNQAAVKKIKTLENDLLLANKRIKALTKSLDETKTLSQKSFSWADFKSQIEIQQRQFCTLTDAFFQKLQEAKETKNEIRVNLVFMERQEDLDALIPKGKFANWIFEVVKIDQVPDGSAAVILKLQCDTTVGSGYLEKLVAAGEDGWRATIPYNDRRYRELAKLSAGQFVTASGQFLEVNKFKPGQPETFYASMPIGDHPLVRDMRLSGELFVADFSYIAALTN